MRTRVAPFLIAGLVLAAAACGSSSTNADTGAVGTTTAAPTTTEVTKASFVEQANAVCKQLNTDISGLQAPSSDAEIPAFFTRSADLAQTAVDRMKALPQPAEDAAGLQAVYADEQAVIDGVRANADRLSGPDAKVISDQLDALSSKAKASATAYGLTECATSGTSSGSSASGSGSTGDGSNTTTTSGVSTATGATKAEFLQQANAICTQLNKDAAAIGGKPSTNAEAATLIEKNVDLIDTSVARIKALPQPTEGLAALRASYADIDAASALARQLAAAYRAGNQAEIQALAPQVDAAQRKANASATAYGLTECGTGT
jgi:hypothetical protein